MLQKYRSKFSRFTALLMLALVSPFAFAGGGGGGVDVSGPVGEILAAVGPIGLIGGAVLSVIVAIKVYKWVRRAM